MADTTKANILRIAPELGVKINNVAKVVLVSISTVTDSTGYTVTLDGNDYTINSGVSATAVSIAAALVAEITAIEYTVVDNLNGTFSIVAASAGTDFTVAVTTELSYQVTTKNYDGDALFDLILGDVITQVTEDNFGDEEERAQRYLTAHILSLTNVDEDGNAVDLEFTSEAVGDVQYKKDAKSKQGKDESYYKSTSYGAIYYDIYLRHYFRFL